MVFVNQSTNAMCGGDKETHMCVGQPSLVPYLFLEGKEGGYKMILNRMWLGEFF